IIMLTAYGNIPDGVSSIKRGAFDYLTKGDDNLRIVPVVEKALEVARMSNKLFALEKEEPKGGFDAVIGESQVIKNAIKLATRVAGADLSVLLTGETGTGKEVFANAIHQASKRNKKPFMALNCSALGKELLESELFGHVKGSFTGANSDKTGFFEAADGGTLFLDEIGEMSLDLQAKLLRVLETSMYYKVGSTKEKKADVRIIAATNRDLLKEAEAGRFRLDLYYRLSTFVVELPPLNQRGEDILILANHFVKQAANRMQMECPTLSADLQNALKAHVWKGNLRELKNVMERALILSDGKEMTRDLLPADFYQDQRGQATLIRPNAPVDLSSLEKDHISNMLTFTGGNKTKTAEILGIGVATLYRKIQEYGL
ncbi:MAG: sigma-54 dependent transcriptional regulator, partial [Bacteroidota bacterium]|nr:sigma-54 dependent transcriptional regulator [Bacteroidota bacterium]MDX5430482.1 sigma-54 dependent transcriptional regulator [Bacteroidota bacterium]MDX5469243.1 sigma-54 dependent transcriptional regulator [Bacteroidota bacterium]